MRRFMIGDKISYNGSSERLQRKLSGKLGVIISNITNCDNEYIVDFGDGDYLLEEREMTRGKSTDKEFEITRRRKNDNEE